MFFPLHFLNFESRLFSQLLIFAVNLTVPKSVWTQIDIFEKRRFLKDKASPNGTPFAYFEICHLAENSIF